MNPADGDARHATLKQQRGWAVVADDDTALGSLCTRILSAAGFRSIAAQDGHAALDILHDLASRGEAIDVVIVDQHMPIVSGQQLVDAIRHSRSLAKLPIVMISGTANQSSDIDVFLPKPFERHDLLAAIDTARQLRPR